MEDKKVTISRVSGTNVYPANFMFIAAMNPRCLTILLAHCYNMYQKTEYKSYWMLNWYNL